GLLVALWSANAGMKAVFDALNVVYEEREERGFIRRTLLSMLFTICGLLWLAIAVTGVVVAPVALNFIGLGSIAGELISLLRWPLLFLMATAGISLVYRFGPSRERPRWRWILPGALLASLLWIGGSGLFSWYVANF